ncbi:MAG: PucR family transcriptional regulator [Thermotogota bacterium]
MNKVKNKIEEYFIKNPNLSQDSMGLDTLVNEIEEEVKKDYQIMENSAALLNSLIQGKSIKYIINLGAEILKNPIILVDSAFKVIAYSRNKRIEEIFWKENVERGYCSSKFIKTVKKMKEVKQAPNSNNPYIVTCFASPTRKMVSKVIINHKCVGNLIMLEDHVGFDDKNKELFKTLSNVISEKLSKTSKYSNIKGLMYENFLFDLIENNIKTENILNERAESCGLDINKEYFLLNIDFSKIDKNKDFDSIFNEIQEYFFSLKTIFYKNNFLALINSNNKEIIENNLFQNLLKKYDLNVALSDTFSNFLDFKKYYDQTVFTLNRPISKNQNIHFYSEVKFYDLIDKIKEKINLKEYCQKNIFDLIKNDKNKNTEYFETLKLYLKNNSNIVKTAEELFIHRNTLSYRIKKIEDILGFELNDGEKNFELFFTIKVIEETLK